jgi:hypothetical protein
VLTQLALPGGGGLGVYEPRHARPQSRKRSARPTRSAGKPTVRRAKPPSRKPRRRTRR